MRRRIRCSHFSFIWLNDIYFTSFPLLWNIRKTLEGCLCYFRHGIFNMWLIFLKCKCFCSLYTFPSSDHESEFACGMLNFESAHTYLYTYKTFCNSDTRLWSYRVLCYNCNELSSVNTLYERELCTSLRAAYWFRMPWQFYGYFHVDTWSLISIFQGIWFGVWRYVSFLSFWNTHVQKMSMDNSTFIDRSVKSCPV
jgi:hypothetical protein